jgi:hypothetical protein
MAAHSGPPPTPAPLSGWGGFDLPGRRRFYVKEGVGYGYAYLPQGPQVARDPQGRPRVSLTLVLSRMPSPIETSIAPLIVTGSLALVCTFAVDADDVGALEARLEASCRPYFVREGSSALRDDEQTYVSSAILGTDAEWWLGASLPPEPALQVLHAFDGGLSPLRVTVSLPGGPALADTQVSDLLDGILDGLDRSRFISMIVVNADGSSTPVPPLKRNIQNGGGPSRGAMTSAALLVQGAHLVSLPLAMTPVTSRPSAAALIASSAMGSGTVVNSHAHVWTGVDRIILTITPTLQNYPLAQNPAAPYWFDAVDKTIVWYPPAFKLVTPAATDDPANAVFAFVFTTTGVTMGSGGVQQGLSGTVRLTVKQVMADETVAALQRDNPAPAGANVRPVPLQNLACALEIPYRQAGSTTIQTHRFPGTIAPNGDQIGVTVALLDDWVRLAYSALAFPPATGMPAPRIILDYSFMSYMQPAAPVHYYRKQGKGLPSGKLTAKYIYFDEQGEPHAKAERWDGEQGKEYPLWHWMKDPSKGAAGHWEFGEPSGPKIPYMLPRLLNASRDEVVFITEGEKNANAVADLGLVATTTYKVVGGWTSDLNKWFKGFATIAITEDNDDVGRQHARQVAESLKDVVGSVHVISFAELQEHGDVFDWIKARELEGLKSEAIRAGLLELAAVAPPYVGLSPGALRSLNLSHQPPSPQVIGGGLISRLHAVNTASELAQERPSPILVRRDLAVVGQTWSFQYSVEAPGSPRGLSNLTLATATVGVRPKLGALVASTGQLSTQSIVREEVVQASFNCTTYGNFYLQRTSDNATVAIGCQDSLKLGETALHAFDEIVALRDPGFRVYRSLQQPGRFLVSPTDYRVGRYSESAGAKAFRSMIVLYGLLGNDPASNRYALTATLIPDILPSSLAKLNEKLVAYTPAGSNPSIFYPTDPFVAAKISYTWAVPSAFDEPKANTVLDYVQVTLTLLLAEAALLLTMINHDGVQGTITFTLPDGTAFNSALIVDADIIGPPDSGPVTVSLQSGAATLQNRTAQKIIVTDVVTVTATGATQTVTVNESLLPNASANVSVGAAAVRAFADGKAASPSTIDELDVFVEDVKVTVTFVNQVNFANHQLSTLSVQARFDSTGHVETADLLEGKTADVTFTLPITHYAANRTLQYSLIETKVGAAPSNTAWREWDLNKGCVIGITADQL